MDKYLFYGIDCHISEGKFPDPDKIKDEIINFAILTINQNVIKKTIITSLDIDIIDGVNVIKKNSEKEIILEFASFIEEFKPTLITGYNLMPFHNKYLLTRIVLLKLKEVFDKLTFMAKTERSASGEINKILMFHNNCKSIDIIDIIKKFYQMKNYRFYNVVRGILGEDDMMTVFKDEERTNILNETIENKTKFCKGNMDNIHLEYKILKKILDETNLQLTI